MRAVSEVVPILLAALLALGGCDKSSSQRSHGMEQGHDGHRDSDKAHSSLSLNDGKKWQTDASLRTGMTNVRNQVQAAMKPIHANTYSQDEYRALAAGIEKELGAVMASCKLPENADAQLHVLLTQLFAGTEVMKKGEAPMDGAFQVMRVLESYEHFFDHADWKPLEH